MMPSPRPNQSKPRLARRYVLSAALFAIGVILGPGMVLAGVFYMVGIDQKGHQFTAPGTTTFHANKAEAFLIWDQTNDSDAFNATSDPLRSLAIVVVCKANNRPIPVFEDRGSSSRIGSVHRRSVFTFTTSDPGDYQITVTGSVAPREFVVTPNPFASMFPGIAAVACAGFLGFGFMVASLVVLILAVVSHGRASAAPMAPTT